MSRRILRLSRAVVILLLVFVAAWWADGLLPSSPGVGPLSVDLEEVIIPSFKLKEASISEAVAQLDNVVRVHESSRLLRVLLWDLPDFPTGFRAEIKPTESSADVIPGLELLNGSESLPATGAEPRRSLSVANIPLTELMRYFSGTYDCTVVQQGSNLYVVQANGRLGHPEKKVWKVNPEQFGLSRSVTNRVDLRRYFEKSGVQFHEGDSADYYPRSHRLVVRAFQEEIDLVDAILPWECSFRGRPPTNWELAVAWFNYYREKVTGAFYNAVL